MNKVHYNKILMIVPAYNEEESIKETYQSVVNYNSLHKNKTLDILVVNDGSTDCTKQILEDNNIPHINLIHNLGIGGAVQTGYKYALETKVMIMRCSLMEMDSMILAMLKRY